MDHTSWGYVIGVSSPTGGGKTALVHSLAQKLDDAIVLSFDEYDEAGTITHPVSYRSWYLNGPDYNAWQASRLAADLENLKSGHAISCPADQRFVTPAKFIVFDAPLGRAHEETGRHIDFMVYIDTPLDVAMARRILRDFYGSAPCLSDERSRELRRDLEAYLEFAREIYLEFVRQVKPKCDLVLDGILSSDELANQVVRVLQK